MASENIPPTVLSPHDTLPPTVQRKPEPVASADAPHHTPPTSPTILLNQERLLSQVPRTTHDGKEAPLLGGVPLLSKIGQGGMGAVYLGVCPKSGDRVAVKVLPLQMEDQTHAIERFLREARLATVVKSPHLVAVRDVGHDGGLYFFQMEFVRGKSAGSFLRSSVGANGNTGIDEGTALDICIAATQGLSAAHAADIIHRDIKPDNILIPEHDTSGELLFEKAKLADLGLARSLADDQTMTATQTALGTPGYMAPEQCRDAKRAEMTADVFSMGATLYALLAGRPPFQGRTSVDTILATLTRQHVPVRQIRSDVSEMTNEVIERCLSKEPRIRYENAGKLLDALLACRDLRRGMSTLGVGLHVSAQAEATVREVESHAVRSAPAPRPVYAVRASAPVRRGPNLLALALGTALIAGAVAWTFQNRPGESDGARSSNLPVTPGLTLSAPVPGAPKTESAALLPAAQAPAVRRPEEGWTPAEILLQRIHAGEEKMPVKNVAPQAKALASREGAAAKPAEAVKVTSDLDARKAKQMQQWREELEQATARLGKLERDVELAREAVQKAKSELDVAQRDIENVQKEERGMKDQLAQMEMKMRSSPPPKQGGRKPDRGGPPQQDGRGQQMIAQFNDLQARLRERMNMAQHRVRERSQALNQATYELQKAEGLARLASSDAQRLKDKILSGD